MQIIGLITHLRLVLRDLLYLGTAPSPPHGRASEGWFSLDDDKPPPSVERDCEAHDQKQQETEEQ